MDSEKLEIGCVVVTTGESTAAVFCRLPAGTQVEVTGLVERDGIYGRRFPGVTLEGQPCMLLPAQVEPVSVVRL